MKHLSIFIFILLIISSIANATILTFDDISIINHSTTMPGGYGQLLWTNTGVFDSSDPIYSGYGYKNAAISTPNAAFSLYSMPITIKPDTANSFTFIDAYFTSGINTFEQVQITGIQHNTTYLSSIFSINKYSPRHIILNWEDLTSLYIVGLCGPIAFDNFQYTFTSSSTPVPEPATIILVGLGLLGMSTISRKYN